MGAGTKKREMGQVLIFAARRRTTRSELGSGIELGRGGFWDSFLSIEPAHKTGQRGVGRRQSEMNEYDLVIYFVGWS